MKKITPTAPAMRFRGFTDDWEQRKLGELGEIMTGSTPSTSKMEYYSDDGIPWVTPTDIKSFTISDTPKKLSEEGAKVGRVVPANTILCTCIASIGKNALLTVEGSFNQQINSLTPNDNNDSYFLLAQSELWSNQMKRLAASGTVQIVNKTEFSNLLTMIPQYAEQKKIGVYFKNLDNLITLHQRKLDQQKQLKKYFLQNMLPAKGEKVPKIRFQGFSGDWEQRKLGDEAIEIIAGGDVDKSKLLERGRYPVIANALTNDGIVGYYENDYRIKAPAVTVTGRGDVGHAQARKFNFTPVVRLLAVYSNHDVDFLAEAINQCDVVLESTGVPQLTVPKLANYCICFPPTFDEEVQIGAYLYKLDHLITLQQHKIDQLQDVKKFMLQNLFV